MDMSNSLQTDFLCDTRYGVVETPWAPSAEPVDPKKKRRRRPPASTAPAVTPAASAQDVPDHGRIPVGEEAKATADMNAASGAVTSFLSSASRQRSQRHGQRIGIVGKRAKDRSKKAADRRSAKAAGITPLQVWLDTVQREGLRQLFGALGWKAHSAQAALSGSDMSMQHARQVAALQMWIGQLGAGAALASRPAKSRGGQVK